MVEGLVGAEVTGSSGGRLVLNEVGIELERLLLVAGGENEEEEEEKSMCSLASVRLQLGGQPADGKG